MKNNKSNNATTFIILGGVLILTVFAIVIAINLLPKNESDSYYVKVDEEMEAKIESLKIEDGKLTITTSGEVAEYCVKSTRSKPKMNAICWKKMTDNSATMSIFLYKKYYVWIKDIDGNISNYLTINSNGKVEK